MNDVSDIEKSQKGILELKQPEMLEEFKGLASRSKVGKAADVAVAYSGAIKPSVSRAYFAAKKALGLVAPPKSSPVLQEVPPDLSTFFGVEKQSQDISSLKDHIPSMVDTAARAAIAKYQTNVEDGQKWLGLKGKIGKGPWEGVGDSALTALKKHPATQGVINSINPQRQPYA